MKTADDLLSWARAVRSAELWASIAQAADGRCILLKGPTFAEALYARGADRPYGDVDVLVPPASLPQVRKVLQDAGFGPRYLVDDAKLVRSDHADTWWRARDRAWVDVHLTLPGVGAKADFAWSRLWAHRRTMQLAGMDVLALDEPAMALHVALHAASHGPDHAQPIRDLALSLTTWGDDVWTQAAVLAGELEASSTFALGLELTSEGRAAALRLGLSAKASAEQRLLWNEAPWGAFVLHGLGQASWPSRALILWKTLLPPARSMRIGTPLARRGRSGLMLAYAIRPLRLLLRLPEALRALLRAQVR